MSQRKRAKPLIVHRRCLPSISSWLRQLLNVSFHCVKLLKCEKVFQVCFTMPPKHTWGLFLFGTLLQAALASSNSPPSECLVTSVQLLCANFYVRTIDRCISNSEPTDIFVKSKDEICYVLFPDRCISADFCPQVEVCTS